MKSQCDKHGCSELLCGCAVEVLEEKSKGEIMWAVVSPKGEVCEWSIADHREVSKCRFINKPNLDFKPAYKLGYRCKKVKGECFIILIPREMRRVTGEAREGKSK